MAFQVSKLGKEAYFVNQVVCARLFLVSLTLLKMSKKVTNIEFE